MDKATVSGSDLPKLVTEAMTAIEDEFEPLDGVLPKDYGIFEPKVLEDLMRLFNRADQASQRRCLWPYLRILPCEVSRAKGA